LLTFLEQLRKRRYEERKDIQESEDDNEDNYQSLGKWTLTKANEGVIEKAKYLFFIIGSDFPIKSESRVSSFGYNTFNDKLVSSTATQLNDEQSIKLSSIYLYTSRILQPIFENNLVFTTTLHKDSEEYPNMGYAEKKVSKLTSLLNFLKSEDKEIKSYTRDRRSTSNTRDTDVTSIHYYTRNYENLISNELDEIDYLKTFILRCIIALEFIDEMSKDLADFSKAFHELPSDYKDALKEIQFRDLTRNVRSDSALRLFIKKLLEIKAQKLTEIKEVQRMWELWHKRCSVFVDREFIATFTAEIQLQRMLETKDFNDEILKSALTNLSKYPFSFEVGKVVELMIRMDKVPELVEVLSVRFLYIEEQENESKKATREAYSHIQEQEYFNKQKEECAAPILEILDRVYVTLISSQNKDINALKLFKSFLDFKKEKSIYDYFCEK